MAREVLVILSQPHVVRSNPAECSVLACATVLLEELSNELKLPGAEPRDLVDALRCIRAMGPVAELAPWVPYLEGRCAEISPRAV